jgi:hypothetical protein
MRANLKPFVQNLYKDLAHGFQELRSRNPGGHTVPRVAASPGAPQAAAVSNAGFTNSSCALGMRSLFASASTLRPTASGRERDQEFSLSQRARRASMRARSQTSGLCMQMPPRWGAQSGTLFSGWPNVPRRGRRMSQVRVSSQLLGSYETR